MRASEALEQNRQAIREVVRVSRTSNPRVFGSVLHGVDNEKSDLDILVDTLPGATLFDLGNLQFELETLLEIPVDLMTPEDLPAKFRDHVLSEAEAV